MTHIVVVGGGAGGLELVTLLGRKFKRDPNTTVTLVDATTTHLWKPLLHEAAAGSLDTNEDEINYLAFSSSHHFKFVQGTMTGLSRSKKQITIAPLYSENKELILPQRELSYDVLVLAVGSVANDFNLPGVQTYCSFIDTREQADHFHTLFLNKLLQFSNKNSDTPFYITVVGGGATGIELIAEIHYAVHTITQYGRDVHPEQIKFILIEAAKQLLPSLPERISKQIYDELQQLGVTFYLGEQVTAVTENGFVTQSGQVIPGDLKIWTAGIKAPDFLSNLGLATNRVNQLLVKPTLQTTEDDAIFAMGDCACCPQPNTDLPVPPRAQAAHQEAIFLAKAIIKYLKKQKLPEYRYRDYGSLISLSRYNIVGNLMGRITKSLKIEGAIARFVYRSLYKKHQTALYGPWKVTLLTLANLLSKRVKPRLKLH